MVSIATRRAIQQLSQIVSRLGVTSITGTRNISVASKLAYPLPIDGEEEQKKHDIASEFVNRNPRNLELLGIAHKRGGWWLQAPRKDFYHNIVFEKEKRHTSAKLMHTSGLCVLSASTRESAISQHLASNSDINAAYNIGRVFAHRCHQAGIDCMIFDNINAGQAIEMFTQALTEGGLTLEEPEANPYDEHDIGTDYDNLDSTKLAYPTPNK